VPEHACLSPTTSLSCNFCHCSPLVAGHILFIPRSKPIAYECHGHRDDRRNGSAPFLRLQLHDTYPNTTLPPLPEIVRSTGVAQATTATGNGRHTKQPGKSSFQRTLSRLVGKVRHNKSTSLSASGPSFPPSPSSSSSALRSQDDVGILSEYLTTLANHPTFSSADPWTQLVHVRADDIQLQRADRMINHVPSEFAGDQCPTTITSAGPTPWQDSSRSAQQPSTSVAPVVTPSPGAMVPAPIHGIEDDMPPEIRSDGPEAAKPPKQCGIMSEVKDIRGDESILKNLVSDLASSNKQSLSGSAALSKFLGMDRALLCQLRGSSAAAVASALHFVRSWNASDLSHCLAPFHSNCTISLGIPISTPRV
jgi:hypothetical protein